MENQKSPFAHGFDNAWEKLEDKEMTQVMALGEAYKTFLDAGKTERRCVTHLIKEAEAQGFRPLKTYLDMGHIKPGDKVYIVSHHKAVALFVMGQEELDKGMHIVGSHIDSPRLDVKP